MFPSDSYSRSSAEARAQEGRMHYQSSTTSHARFHEGEAWVHWEYSPDEWVLFDKVDWNATCLIFWGLVPCCAASVIAAIPWFTRPAGTLEPYLNIFLLAVLAWCVFVPLTMSYLFSYIDARKRHKARQQEPRTVTISKEGVWEAGTFFPLNKFLDANLKKVTLTLDPPVLHFRLTRYHIGKNWRSSPTSITLHIPVPRGQEEEAGFLQQRFQTEVIQARAQLEKRLNNPPEPR